MFACVAKGYITAADLQTNNLYWWWWLLLLLPFYQRDQFAFFVVFFTYIPLQVSYYYGKAEQ